MNRITESESYILTGGRSSRMGSNKALLKIGGDTFVRHIGTELKKAGFAKIALIGNAEDEELTAEALKNEIELLPDAEQISGDEKAAILGLYSALHFAKTDFAFVIACDLPLIRSEFIKYLWVNIGDADAVVPVQSDGRYQPFCAFYKVKKCLEAAAHVLHSENRKMTRFLKGINVRLIETSTEFQDCLFNVNTPGELESARKLISADWELPSA